MAQKTKKQRSRRSDKIGLPAGALVPVGGETPSSPVLIRLMDYNAKEYSEWQGDSANFDLMPQRRQAVRWLHLDGTHDPQLVQRVGHQQGLRDLTIEDLLNSDQRPKMDECSETLFLVLNYPIMEEKRVSIEAVHLVLGPATVLSLLAGSRDPLEPLRERIRNGRGRARQRGADYLAYCILDLVVDSFFLVVEDLQEDIEQLQEEIQQGSTGAISGRLQALRQAVMQLLRVARPMHDIIAAVHRMDSPLVQPSTKPYLADILDHLNSIVDNAEHFRGTLDSILEIHLAIMSNNMNQVVKRLTIFTAVFMPLSFLAGIYGMNFRYLPGQDNPAGFLIILVGMLVIGLGMLLFFRWKKWL